MKQSTNILNPFNTSVQAHKERVHFTDTALLNATNPIKVHLIGSTSDRSRRHRLASSHCFSTYQPRFGCFRTRRVIGNPLG